VRSSEQVQELPNDYKIAGKTFGPFAKVGFAVRKGDATMKDAMAASLAAIKADGKFDAILKKHGMPMGSKLD
jgi:ABC-type amino acid transport substrate-binding protein